MSGKIITFICIVLTTPHALLAQDRGVEFLSGPEFKLSEKAVAAGIDGTLTVVLKIDRTGKVKEVKIFAGPIWPCNSSPESVIKEVREAVKQNILASKFTPAIKKGRPVDAEATLDFAIGNAYREAKLGQVTSKSRWVVDVGAIQAKAARLSTPGPTGLTGTVAVRVLIGESGNVISAGAVSGHRALYATSRRAACESIFPATIADGKPTKVTGLIHYEYGRGYVRVR